MRWTAPLLALLALAGPDAFCMTSAELFTVLSETDLIREYQNHRRWDGFQDEETERQATRSFMQTWSRVTSDYDYHDVMGASILRTLSETRFIADFDADDEWLGHRSSDGMRIALWEFMRVWGRNVLLMRNLGASPYYPGLEILSRNPWPPADATFGQQLSTATIDAPEPQDASPPKYPPLNLEWALAYEKSLRTGHGEPRTPEELNARFRERVALDEGCTRCLAATYHGWKDSLKHYFRSDANRLIAQVELEQYQNDPVRLAPLLKSLDRTNEAERVALEALATPILFEDRQATLHLLIDIYEQRGEQDQADHYRTQVRPTGLSRPGWCASKTDFDRDRMLDFVGGYNDRIARVTYYHELYLRKPGDCLAESNYLQELGSLAKDGLPGEKAALFPDGVTAELLRILRATPLPEIRAARLISMALFQIADPDGSPLLLLDEAAAIETDPRMRFHVLDARRKVIEATGQQEDYRSAVVTLVRDYPDHRVSAKFCSNPRAFHSVKEWADLCWDDLRWRKIDNPYRITQALDEDSGLSPAWLLENDPPRILVPHLLQWLSDEVRETDPERARRLEQEALRHPESRSGLRGTNRRDREAEAAGREDYEAAFIQAVQSRPTVTCGSDTTSIPAWEIRLAFYKVMLGIEPDKHWGKLVALMPSGTELRTAYYFHQPSYIDLVVRAARAARRECDALEWIGSLRDQYRNLVAQHSSEERSRWRAARLDPRTTELVLAGSIEELRSSLPQGACGSQAAPSSP